MANALSALKAAVFGRRESSLSIPIMDGSLKPNNLLEDAPVFAERHGLEDLALGADGELYAACGKTLFRVSPQSEFVPVAAFDRTVTAIAIFSNGSVAVALGNAVVLDAGTPISRTISSADGRPFVAVNALHAKADGSLLISDGSASQACSKWSRDLLNHGNTGRVLELDPVTGSTTTLASSLAYAFGVCANEQGKAIVSESWRHRLSLLDGSNASPALVGLPGYPARIALAEGGGYWLSLFACRTQLVEFVLREDDYREEMMRTIPPNYWVAPAMSSGKDFLEPLQGGGVKQMGILKPWAPPRSYGLVVRIGADFIPKYSLHSRVGGRHHGVVKVLQRGDDLFVLSKGAGRILRLSISKIYAGNIEGVSS
jgi:hypothetical protein